MVCMGCSIKTVTLLTVQYQLKQIKINLMKPFEISTDSTVGHKS